MFKFAYDYDSRIVTAKIFFWIEFRILKIYSEEIWIDKFNYLEVIVQLCVNFMIIGSVYIKYMYIYCGVLLINRLSFRITWLQVNISAARDFLIYKPMNCSQRDAFDIITRIALGFLLKYPFFDYHLMDFSVQIQINGLWNRFGSLQNIKLSIKCTISRPLVLIHNYKSKSKEFLSINGH